MIKEILVINIYIVHGRTYHVLITSETIALTICTKNNFI